MAKTVLITGASSGIGRITAELFARRGWQVVWIDGNVTRGVPLARRATVAGGVACADSRDAASLQQDGGRDRHSDHPPGGGEPDGGDLDR